MRKFLQTLKTACFFALGIFLLYSFFLVPLTLAAPGTPTIISYQGRLTNSSGSLLGGASGTTYYFKFSIWDNSTVGSGIKLWPAEIPATTTASVREGVFNVNIGDTANGYPDSLNYNFNTNKDIYLQVEVSDDNDSSETLSPRQRISSASFAQLAGAVSGTTTPSTFGTTTPIGSSQVTIEATSTNSIPLTIRAALSQVANLFNIENSSGDKLIFSNATGGLFASSTFQSTGLSTFYGGIFSDSASSTIASLTVVSGTTTNATTTNLVVTGTASTSALTISNGLFQGGFDDCSLESQTVLYNSTSGKFSCGFDSTGGGGAELNWTYVATEANSSKGRIYVSTTTNQVVIGASATTSLARLEVIGNQYISGNLGIGTTSPYSMLSVAGQVVGQNFIATSTTAISSFQQLLANASTTLQNFTGLNSTTPNATSTTSFAGTASSTNLFSTTLTTGNTSIGGTLNVAGASTLAALTTGLINGQTISSAANLTGTLAVAGVSALQGLTFTSATGTAATTTNFFSNNIFTPNLVATTSATLGTTPLTSLSVTNLGATSTFAGFLNVTAPSLSFGTSTFTGDLIGRGIAALDALYVGRTSTSTIPALTGGTSTLQAFLNVLGTNSTSTFSGFLSVTKASTTATSTLAGLNLRTGGLTLQGLTSTLIKTDSLGAVVGAVAGQDYARMSDTFGKAWELLSTDNTILSQTTTLKGILVNNSTSTITNLTSAFSTSTFATSTTLSTTNASTTNLTLSSAGTGSTKCLQVSGIGLVSAAAGACGTGSASD